MLTNRQILDIITKKEEHEKQLLDLDVAKAVCEYFYDTNAVNDIQEEYNRVVREYNQWLESEVRE